MNAHMVGVGVLVVGDSIAREVGAASVLRGCATYAQDGSRLGHVAGQVARAAATLGADASSPIIHLVLVCSGANDGGDAATAVQRHASRIAAAVEESFSAARLVFLRSGWLSPLSELFSLQAARALQSGGHTVKDIDGSKPYYGLPSEEGARVAQRGLKRQCQSQQKETMHYLPPRGDRKAFLEVQVAGIIKACIPPREC